MVGGRGLHRGGGSGFNEAAAEIAADDLDGVVESGTDGNSFNEAAAEIAADATSRSPANISASGASMRPRQRSPRMPEGMTLAERVGYGFNEAAAEIAADVFMRADTALFARPVASMRPRQRSPRMPLASSPGRTWCCCFNEAAAEIAADAEKWKRIYYDRCEASMRPRQRSPRMPPRLPTGSTHPLLASMRPRQRSPRMLGHTVVLTREPGGFNEAAAEIAADASYRR